ncbi:vomeronasal type-1 receptor 4-like [Apodemus sylvaticus]|uniref:vomeronasal type-1 receptor 4-like n=1 Tax=Apodemus sylvaticus TaxID=10129 RepID=UPI00224277FF|nr:vomeronasal type-1 receptor 4-like [Apodemus sylvaticus]
MSSQNKTLITVEEVALHMLLFCQVGVGTLANILLFVNNFSPILTDFQLKPIQVILTNLSVGNVLILLLLVFPNNMTPFVPRKPLTDLKCKLGFFFPLVARSANMCSTCALSTYQFATIAPSTWGQVMFRDLSPKVLSYSCYSCWLFGVLSNAYVPMKVSGPQKKQDNVDSKSKLVCSTSGFRTGMSFLRFAHDTVFIIIIVWTSISMVIHLNKHHQRVQHIRTPNQGHRGQAETRATHTILMVMVTFVCFYLLDCVCNIFHISFGDSHLWLKWITEVLTAGFPTISPLLLILRDPKDPCSVLLLC